MKESHTETIAVSHYLESLTSRNHSDLKITILFSISPMDTKEKYHKKQPKK